MARKIAAYDWSSHPLGPIDRWPMTLRTALGMALDSGFPMFLVWTNQFYAFYNDAYIPILGSKEPHALGRRFEDLWSEAWPVVGPIAEKAYAGETSYFDDLPIVVDRHGYPEQTYFSFSYSPVRDDQGGVAGVLCTVFETTTKVSSLTLLKQSEDRLQLSLEASDSIGIWSVDMQTLATTVDARFARLFHVDPSAAERGELLLSTFTDRIHPEDQPRVLRAIANTMEMEQPYEEEYRLTDSDNTTVWVAVKGRVFTNEDTGEKRFAGVAVDITPRKHIEENLRRLADDLTQTNRRQQEFLAILAHELRNPLAPIRTGLDLIAASGEPTAMTARICTMMSRQVNHLVHLVDDLLDLSRVTTGKIALKMGYVTIRDVVSQAIEMVDPALKAKRHRFSAHVPDEAIWIHADINRIVQVVVNVLSNAAKYTLPGGEIDLMVTATAEWASIVVTDNGIGISSDSLPRVFNMFNQVNRDGQYAQGGLGIGLALVKRLTEMHGGTISAESAGLNHGSTFTIRLHIAQPAAGSAASSINIAAHEPASIRSLRILLADDNEDALSMLAHIVEMDGHQVRTAPDGEQALLIAREWAPDLALLDLGMPNLNGFQTAQAMRSSPTLKGVRLAALTGWGAAEDRLRTAQAGFNRHFTKPVDIHELRSYLAAIAAYSD
ncbi:PAS domain-containing hybrid sensor histidine kinase/response regulator [Noviherbaspirillum pedocola]|uniref:histidine kinase n=1 Tax=Noviherbaspirillum pedocola TaxID=2801341 RepID=A0A934T0R1_9BURK|nr:ATP-binding protein [Noviherbaspirillum pedocola]MBK4739357.1 response regulator [Noviherbaspirillum pedocola]